MNLEKINHIKDCIGALIMLVGLTILQAMIPIYLWDIKGLFYWFMIGLPCSLYWVFKYRKYMTDQEFDRVFLSSPYFAIYGPFSLLLTFPV